MKETPQREGLKLDDYSNPLFIAATHVAQSQSQPGTSRSDCGLDCCRDLAATGNCVCADCRIAAGDGHLCRRGGGVCRRNVGIVESGAHGSTNAISLLVLSGLLAVADAGSAEFILAASVMALLAGIIQFLLGMARLGVLVNFVSHSVIVGFASAAGVLIAIKQLKPLFGLEFSSHGLVENVHQVVVNLPELNPATTALGVGTIIFMFVLKRINDRLPAALICMIIASILVAVFGLAEQGVATIGELLRSLPPLTSFESVNLDLFSNVATGALAVAAIALVETTAISRSIATQTGQRLDSNQEFVGQGLANIAVGMFSGYPVAGSFSRSAVNFKSGAQTRLAAVFSGIFVLIALFTLGPLGRYLPTSALAGVLIVTAWGMIDRTEIARITRGARYDAIIMWITFIATLFLHIEFAVLLGILFSFAFYIMNSSVPQVEPVLPDKEFKHFFGVGRTQRLSAIGNHQYLR